MRAIISRNTFHWNIRIDAGDEFYDYTVSTDRALVRLLQLNSVTSVLIDAAYYTHDELDDLKAGLNTHSIVSNYHDVITVYKIINESEMYKKLENLLSGYKIAYNPDMQMYTWDVGFHLRV